MYWSYKLKKDLPEFPKGTELKWDCWTETYTEYGDYIGLNPPKPKLIFTMEIISNESEWFEPIGKPREYYPKFPSLKEFYNKDNGHVYGNDLRHNDMCRICQLIKKLDIENKLQEADYNIYKTEYEKRFNLT